jgi:replicative DNA helicase
MTVPTTVSQFIEGRERIRFDDEAGLLGHILSSINGPAAYRVASSILNYEQFGTTIFKGVFFEIGQAIEKGCATTPDICRHVKGALCDNPNVKELFGDIHGMMLRLVQAQILPIQLEATAQQIKREWLIDESDAARETGDFQTVSEISREVRSIDNGMFRQNSNLLRLGGIANDTIIHLNEIFQTGVIEGFAYAGCADIESVIGGWKPGRYYVIGARPSMGKSTFGLSMLRKTASKGHGVMIVSLEMTSQELGSIALCDTALEAGERIEYRDIQPDRFVYADDKSKRRWMAALLEAQDKIEKLPLQISDKAGMSISEIRTMAAKYAEQLAGQGKKLEVILIDHLNLIKPDDRYKGVKSVETEQISNQLKVLAKDLGVAVVCLVQLNRGVEGRDDKMPSLADLRWSGAIEQDADVVMFLYRKAYYLERKREEDELKEAARLDELDACRNELEVLFAKNRGGPCPLVRLWADMGVGAVRDAVK